MENEIIIPQGQVAILAIVGLDNYVCPKPMVNVTGKLDNSSSISIGRFQYATKFKLANTNDKLTDSLGNVFFKVNGNSIIIIELELIGTRPPILHYP